MLLVVDVGNSNIVLALWDGVSWKHRERVETHPLPDVDAFKVMISGLLSDINFDGSAIVSSVVPAVNDALLRAVTEVTGKPPVILSATTDSGITLAAERPDRVGADLIADAAGARALVQEKSIVVDLGTATTVMAVEQGAITGVAICAGLKVSVEALVGKAAQLQDIPLEIPASPLGKNTVQAMQAGLVLGHLCMIEGLIDRIKKEIGPAKVIATGGLVSLMAPHTEYFDYVEPMLTLNGLRAIAEGNNQIS